MPPTVSAVGGRLGLWSDRRFVYGDDRVLFARFVSASRKNDKRNTRCCRDPVRGDVHRAGACSGWNDDKYESEIYDMDQRGRHTINVDDIRAWT